MDTVSKKKRSWIMSRIRSVSKMEIAAAKLAAKRAGCRVVHHPKGIPGNPDYANKARRVAVFIHGCFFHFPCPKGCAKMPKSNIEFWKKKFTRNAYRHNQVIAELESQGWWVITIWEHEVRKKERV